MKSNFLKTFIQNFSYSFGLNIANLIIRTTYVFILPKIISVVDFGYWQLYFLYSSFLHFGHMGLVDGVYLKNGGLLYDDLDHKKLRPQFFILLLMGIAFAIIASVTNVTFVEDYNKKYLLYIVCVDLILMLPRTLLSVIFQATGMIKEFAISLLSETLISFILVLGLLGLGIRDFKIIILADCFARIVSLGVSIHNAPGFIKFVVLKKQDFIEAYENIKIGVFLLLANMAGMVILAIVRLSIEQKWGIVAFSKISLSFSIANVVMIAVSAAGVVLFPILRRLEKADLMNFYLSINKLLVMVLLVALSAYYPIVQLLELWLPVYSESFKYLGIVAPMCLYEAQLVLVANNYLKTIRCERVIFKINMIAILLVTIVSALTTFLNLNLEMLMFSVVFISLFKATISDWFICSYLKNKRGKSYIVSYLVTIMFIYLNFYLGGIKGFVFYLLFILGVVVLDKNNIKRSIEYFNTIK